MNRQVLRATERRHDDCCDAKGVELAQVRDRLRGVLQIVLAINVAMFALELGAGVLARSSALIADSVDMLGDAWVYVLSLVALYRGPRWRAGAALAKGLTIAVFGIGVITEVGLKIRDGVMPLAPLMVGFGVLALAANLTCLALLYRYRAHDVNMSSAFECSRNDVIANVGVLLAAAGVWWWDSAWPDIAVGLTIAALFLRSSVRVVRQAWPEFRAARPGLKSGA
jgi:Co/Zn/Cd efflux system component